MIYFIIYVGIGLWLGLRALNNCDEEDVKNNYYFMGLVMSGLTWPITVIIGVISILKNRKK